VALDEEFRIPDCSIYGVVLRSPAARSACPDGMDSAGIVRQAPEKRSALLWYFMRARKQIARLYSWYLPGLLIFAVCCAQASDTGVGTISGRVQDPAGAALEGVRVTLSDASGRSVAVTATTSNGAYIFERLKAAKYELKAERLSFLRFVSADIDLTVQQKATVDLTLQPLQPSAAPSAEPGRSQSQTSKTVGYYQSSSLKADGFAGSVDPAGYSAAASADTSAHLLEGAATLRQESRPNTKPDKAAEASGHSADLCESELKRTVEKNPQSFQANHDLGKLYLGAGEPARAIPYLEQAYRSEPSDLQNGYDLAVAYLKTGNLPAAGQQVQGLLKRSDSAQLHRLSAEVEEGGGNFPEAAKEYQRAAQIEPSPQNIFDWGSELLLHRSIEPALEVFQAGVGRYPKSPEMWIGLGIALYLRGNQEEAVQTLVQAADLDPSDDRPYTFLAYAFNASPKEGIAVTQRLKRFADLHPQDARAVYYYALSLWKGSRREGAQEGLGEVEALLKKSSTLDPKFPDAHLQLANLYASQQKDPEAIDQYRLAIELDPESAAAHYKLGQALARIGQHEPAEQEFKLYQRLHQQPGAAREKDQGKEQQLIKLVKEGSSPTR